ncbi:carbohydrate-binding domain-containing protein [uncultured Ruminococcus sp.]|uniref:carbohydrate-binding domain-containing protein n=1 Tax=uncultured Ruminococcus sp. TaxID=165186 RepID=UPI0025E0C2EC|nr:carbohydrate-binding domain-containing protein [uncultured Ruminococcus sp.]
MSKKHILAGILSAVVLGSVSAASAAAADTLYGDANCDGTVDMSDAVLIMQSLANPGKYGVNGTDSKHITQVGIDFADVCENGNGLTTNDALSIQNYLLGNIKSLPESYKSDSSSDEDEKETVKTKIHLSDSGITIDGEYAAADGSKVTITHSGEFTIDGTLSDGQICVDIPDEKTDKDTVKLVLKGVNITGSSAPAILVSNADKTSITAADGTENIISDGTSAYTGDEAESAVIEAKDDLTIKGGDNGTGTLTINANIQPAIVCNNDLKITGGILNVNTLNEAQDVSPDTIKGKGSVTVKGGTINIVSKGDGIKSSKGEVVIEDGTIVIKASKDAIQAETDITIAGGDIAAFGDKGLTAAGNVNITGGSVVATASDNQCETLASTEQAALMLDFTKEWSKNNPISVTDPSNKVLIEKNTLKKYKYAIVSSPDIASGELKVFAGGIKMKHSEGSTFKSGKPAKYTEVNNDMDNEEQLYEELFSQEKIHKIDIQIDEAVWDNLLKTASKEEWTPCDVVIDGETIRNAGIRAKGNSSLMMAKDGKYSFRLKLDKYDKENNYHGLTEFCMNNMLMDASCLRDIICYNAMYEVGGVAPHAAHTDMYLNGNLYSFYLLAEQPGTTLAERYAVDDDSVLYKATEKTGNENGGWGGFGGDSYCSFTENMPLDRFDVKFGTDDEYSHIQDVKTAINKLTPTDYKFIEDVIDVPSFLKGFAVNSIFCNYDSYNGSLAHNYYLMYSGGRMHFVGWDYNLCLGNFTGGANSVTSDIKTSLYQSTIEDRPLAKLLQVPEYYDMYVDIVKDIINYYSDPEKYVADYSKKIRSHVEADPRFEFTIEDFDTNTSASEEGLQYSEEDTGNAWGNWGGFGGGDANGEGGAWGGFGGGDANGEGGAWGDFGGGDANGEGGAWGGFGGDASFDWANMDWENMDWSNMDWGDMDWGDMDFGGGMFGGGQTSVVDFLIKRFEIILEALKD